MQTGFGSRVFVQMWVFVQSHRRVPFHEPRDTIVKIIEPRVRASVFGFARISSGRVRNSVRVRCGRCATVLGRLRGRFWVALRRLRSRMRFRRGDGHILALYRGVHGSAPYCEAQYAVSRCLPPLPAPLPTSAFPAALANPTVSDFVSEACIRTPNGRSPHRLDTPAFAE